MPSKSPAQARLMRARAHGWKPDRIKGPSVKVAKEFVAADKKAKGMLFGGLFKSGLFTSGSTKKKTGKYFKKFLAEQEKEKADVAAITRPWEAGEGPLWDETIYALEKEQGKDRELIGPRTISSPPIDPSKYLIHLNPVAPDFEGEVDTSGYWGHKLDAARIAELEGQGYTAMTGRDSGYWTPPTGRAWDPTTFQGGLAEATAPPEELERTIDPVPGREFFPGDAPAAPARTAADIAPGFRPGRVPPSLLRYLEKSRAAAGEPVKMQGGGMMNFMFRGQGPMPQVPGGGFTGGGFGGKGPGQWMTQGRVPQQGGGQFKGMGRGMNSMLQQMQQRRQAPGGGGGQGQPRPQTQGPESFRRQMPGTPGGGVPLRGVGRPPGMGRPGAGSGYESNQPVRSPGSSQDEMRAYRAKRAAMGQGPGGGRAGIGMGMPGGGGPGGVRPAVMPGRGFMPTPGPTGGGGAGTPGGANRIGMGDQQGALARAMQTQTGRPPISRRQPFPGRGGPGGGFGRSRRRRGRGRMRR